MRSVLRVAERLDVPVLILAYRDHPLFPDEQATSLHERIQTAGGDSRLHLINALSSDFSNDEALNQLFSWVHALGRSIGENTTAAPSVRFHFAAGPDASAIQAEAERAMREVNELLGLTLPRDIDCYMDPALSDSTANFVTCTIRCANPDAFVHEYIHMLLTLHPDRKAYPKATWNEGAATYFSYIWEEQYGHSYTHLAPKHLRAYPPPKRTPPLSPF